MTELTRFFSVISKKDSLNDQKNRSQIFSLSLSDETLAEYCVALEEDGLRFAPFCCDAPLALPCCGANSLRHGYVIDRVAWQRSWISPRFQTQGRVLRISRNVIRYCTVVHCRATPALSDRRAPAEVTLTLHGNACGFRRK